MTGPRPEQPAAPSPESGSAAAESAPGGGPPGRRRPVPRVLRVLGGALASLLLLVLVLSGLVLGTQTGLETALGVADALAPGLIRVDRVAGRVLGRLQLEGVTLDLGDLQVQVGRLDLDWAPLAAVSGTLPINRLAVKDLDIVSTPSQTPEDAAPLVLPDIDLPIGIDLGEGLVENLRILHRSESEPLFVLDRATLGAGLDGSLLDLRTVTADLAAFGLKARAAGRAELARSWPLDLGLDVDLTREPAVSLAGRGRISGGLDRLTLDYALTGSVEATVKARVDDLPGRPAWEALVEIKGVRAPDFQADAPPIDLRGRLETTGDVDAATLTGTLDGSATGRTDFGQLHADLDARWADRRLDLRTLDFTETVSGARLNAQGELDLKASPGRLRFTADWERLRWPLTGAVLAAAPRGRLDASGTFDAYDYAVAAAVEGPGFPAVALDLKGSGDAQRTRIANLGVRTLGGNLEANGDLAWSPELTWDLKLGGRDLNPAGVVPGREDRIGFSAATKGGLKGYSYDLTLGTQGPGLPPARLYLGGTGDLKGTVVDTLRLDALKGRLTGRARAAWDPVVTWEADLTAAGLDPGAWAPDWPGRIDGRLSTSGSLDPQGPNLSVALSGVQGTLRGYPVAVAGTVRMTDGTLGIQGLDASSGPSRARVDGTVGIGAAPRTLDLRFDLDSPDLASLLPAARGRVQARGRVSGPLDTPAVKLDLEVREAALAGQSIASLKGAVDLSLAPDGPLRVQLDGQGLAAGALRWERLRLGVDGRLPNHRLSLTAKGEPLSVDLEASGGLRLPVGGAVPKPLQYQGSLSRLDLGTQGFGDWRLPRAVPFSLAGGRMGAGPLCLRNAQGSGGCVEFTQTEPGQWTLDLDLSPLGTDLIAGLLPPTLSAEGSARVRGRFTARGPLLTGSAVAEVPRGQLRIAPAGAPPVDLDLSGIRLDLEAGERGLGARLALPLGSFGRLGGTLDLPGWRLDDPARPGQPLRGDLRGSLTGLGLIADLVPDLSSTTGRLDLNLGLAGTLVAPALKGQAALRGFVAEVPLTGTRISGLDLVATALGERVTLQGQGDVGGRPLRIDGAVRLGPGGPAGSVSFAGQRLKVADTQEYFVLATPQVTVGFAPEGLHVRGSLSIPEARIHPRKLPPGVVLPSPDVVIVGQGGASGPLPLDLDLTLSLGNKVTLDAFGVRGRLTGGLHLTQVPGRQLVADGQLAILDGTYRFSAGLALPLDMIPILNRFNTELGVPLTIVQGMLLYVKTPIGNPGVLLVVERDNGSMSAGIRVVGTLRNPRFAFFSESNPGLSQAEITKYLLTGIAPSGDAAGPSLTFGTWVSPKLYVEYINGLGDQQNAVQIRYDLTRSIQLQAESGATPGADIFYKFER